MLRKWYDKLFENKKTQPIHKRPRVQLGLETLEDRVVPASLTVMSTADDGSAGTLRWAIAQANASSDATNKIDFNLPSGPQTIVLTQGALVLNNSHSTIVQGTGAEQLFISGNNSSGVFSIGYRTTVELDDLTIEDGSDTNGGGIFSEGNLTVNNSTVSDNTANNNGGGIYSAFGTAAINNTTISGNTASYSGGGVYNSFAASANINASTLSNNTAGTGGGIYNFRNATVTLYYSTLSDNTGGGIYNYDYATATVNYSIISGNTSVGGIYNILNSMANINNSTLSDNSNDDNGGGIYNTGATATINNSILSDNSALDYGGGIYNAYSATTIINDSTLSGNSARVSGGGIYNRQAAAELGNSIVAGNTAGTAPDVCGSFDSLGYNLIGNTSGSSGLGAAGDILNLSSAGLDPNGLQNNGGPLAGAPGSEQVLQTIALMPGSAAINAGSNALIPIDRSTGQPYTTDERGPGFARIVGPSVDIGAYELQQQGQTITFNALPARNYGEPDFTLTATASSGLPVSYAATGDATVYQDSSGNWFAHITGAGTAAITAAQAGNSAYSAAPNVSQSFAIGQATPTVPNPIVPSNAVYNGQPQGATVGDVNGVNNADLGAPTLTYYAGSYTLSTLPSSGGSGTAPRGAGNYTVVASYPGSTDYEAVSALATFTIAKASTVLSNLAVQQLTVGASKTTVSGQLTSNPIFPVSQSVAITLNGMMQSAMVGANGSFSASFATSALGVGIYTITFSYAGDNNFTAASCTGSLTVSYHSQLLFNNTKPVHSGSVVPIKLALTDASGADISSPNIAVTATNLVDANGNAVSLHWAGNANRNNLFRYDAGLGGYIFNLDTKGLAAGTYTLYYTVGNDSTKHSLTFLVHH
ncbi:MAG TPA: choice-of-anchor Q domain-containing protein [Gemmataceae bacterium]|jgi:hypothetical protein